MTTLEHSEFSCPMELINRISGGTIKLPVSVNVGPDTFTLTAEIIRGVALGCLMCSAWQLEEE